MEQTVVTQPKRLRPKKPRRRITPATVCQAIHDVPYIVARALIRAVRAVGHCFAWTWDAIVSDVRANWRAFCCGRLVTGCRDALRSPALREVHHIMHDHPSIRAITMKLDENERGNLTRLMKVKDMMIKAQLEGKN